MALGMCGYTEMKEWNCPGVTLNENTPQLPSTNNELFLLQRPSQTQQSGVTVARYNQCLWLTGFYRNTTVAISSKPYRSIGIQQL